MNPDSLNLSHYIEVIHDLKEVVDGSDNYSILYLIGGLLLALSKPIIKLLKRAFRIQKEIITKEIKDAVDEQHNDFKKIIREQVQATKDTINVVKDSVEVIKEDGKLRKEQHGEMMTVMEMHIEELGAMKTQVNDHEVRITSNEKNIKGINGS